jgi:hypothetical protein
MLAVRNTSGGALRAEASRRVFTLAAPRGLGRSPELRLESEAGILRLSSERTARGSISTQSKGIMLMLTPSNKR